MQYTPKNYLTQLAEKGTITSEQASSVEVDFLRSGGGDVSDFIIDQKIVSVDDALSLKAQLLNVEYTPITNLPINGSAVSLIPENLCHKFNVLPFKLNSITNELYVAAANPLDLTTLDFLEHKTGHKVKFTLAYNPHLQDAIRNAFSQNSIAPDVQDAVIESTPTPNTSQNQTFDNIQSTIKTDEGPVTKMINTILEYAKKSRASDIHIEPQETETRVRYRIDGFLQEKLVMPHAVHNNVISRIKILSGLKLDERRMPQDGRFTFQVEGSSVDVRVSTLPTVYGEKVVMRLLQKSGGLPKLPELGLQGANLKIMQDVIKKPYGIVLVTGPTGSGKTTTLYSVLSELNKPHVNIMTLEDPVEYQIDGINQVQINIAAGLTFASGLRSFLRQDPNIILVGEIRDSETTDLAIQAALTGHLVFATLHTNDAATAIPRLIDLGAEPFLISSVVAATLAQRIARQLCIKCKYAYMAPPEVRQQIIQVLKLTNPPADIQLYMGKGCDECGGTGYRGRIGLFEILHVTPSVSQLVLRHATSQQIQEEAVSQGMTTMLVDGFQKALQGVTTIDEVLRIVDI